MQTFLDCKSLGFEVFSCVLQEVLVGPVHSLLEAEVLKEDSILVLVHQHVPFVYLHDPILDLINDIIEVLVYEAHHFHTRH